MNKWKYLTSKQQVAVLDIEVDTITDTLIVVSVGMVDKIYTIISKSMLTETVAGDEAAAKLNYLYDKYIPKNTLASKAKHEFVIVDTELECVQLAFKKLHEWKPDIATIWNITYSMGKMLAILEKNHIDPKDVFSDPRLPEKLRYFKFQEGLKQFVTEAGTIIPIRLEEQWHKYIATAHFYWIDAMFLYNSSNVSGVRKLTSYSLGNVLKQELGDKLGKLKFADGLGENLYGLEWYMYMVDKRPLECIIYNQWDVMSVLELDKKTNYLSIGVSKISCAS